MIVSARSSRIWRWSEVGSVRVSSAELAHNWHTAPPARSHGPFVGVPPLECSCRRGDGQQALGRGPIKISAQGPVSISPAPPLRQASPIGVPPPTHHTRPPSHRESGLCEKSVSELVIHFSVLFVYEPPPRILAAWTAPRPSRGEKMPHEPQHVVLVRPDLTHRAPRHHTAAPDLHQICVTFAPIRPFPR